MAERVAEIQVRPLALLERVGLDHPRLDRDVVGDQVGQVIDVERQRPVDLAFQPGKPVGIADHVVLDALGQAAAQLARGSVPSTSGSISTAIGWWNAPIRFLPTA